jgi:DNA replication protein DnaC
VIRQKVKELLSNNITGVPRGTVIKTLAELAAFEHSARVAYFGNEGRPAPFNVAIVGGPGIGKTFLT